MGKKKYTGRQPAAREGTTFPQNDEDLYSDPYVPISSDGTVRKEPFMATQSVFVRPKFALGSWSIVGGLTMVLTIAAPFISAWTGWDISPDDIQGVSTGLDDALKALGALVGMGAVIIGRIKAGKALQPVTFNPAGAAPVKVEVKPSLGTAVVVAANLVGPKA